MDTTGQRNIEPLKEMTRIANSILGVELRGFNESYRSDKLGKLIYDSEWCRISFIWGGWDYAGGNNVQIRYGRLHAHSEKVTMIWNGEECRCWHDVDHVLHFLDNHQPEDVARFYTPHPLISSFFDDAIRQEYNRRQPEWLAEMHLTIWRHYGKKFFEVFDLRQPDVWQQYRNYLRRFYDIKGRKSSIDPPMDKVC